MCGARRGLLDQAAEGGDRRLESVCRGPSAKLFGREHTHLSSLCWVPEGSLAGF